MEQFVRRKLLVQDNKGSTDNEICHDERKPHRLHMVQIKTRNIICSLILTWNDTVLEVNKFYIHASSGENDDRLHLLSKFCDD